MCGRFTLLIPGEELAESFGLEATPALAPRYNIAPTQEAAVVRVDEPGAPRRLAELRWGLVPAWADDPSIGSRLINARAETVAEKPAFRDAFRERRCAVPADGFYEWAETDGGGKQPYVIRLADGGPFAFAGLWERWRGADGEELESFAILTTRPSEMVAEIHDRMPVLLRDARLDLWLDPEERRPESLGRVFPPPPEDALVAYPVSRAVNDPSHDSPACLEPAG